MPAFSLELNLPRYEGGVPPTNTSRARLELSGRFELPTPDYKTGIFPAKLQEHNLAPRLGIEPSSFLINSQAPTPCLLTRNILDFTEDTVENFTCRFKILFHNMVCHTIRCCAHIYIICRSRPMLFFERITMNKQAFITDT